MREYAALTSASVALLTKRYLDGGTFDNMLDRVSGGNETYRNLMSSLRFMPNSPALFNIDKGNNNTSSACFVFNIFDCMLYHEGVIREDSIVRTREKAISVAKAGGGCGYYGGDIRPEGSPVQGTNGVARGPVAVLHDLQGVSHLIKQGAKRELAQMFVLPVWHKDIRKFIHCKDEDPQSLNSFNISVSWDEKHIRLAHPTLPDGYEGGGFKTEMGEIWWEQCQSAWAHGCPGMFFPDTVNRFNPNPHLGLMLAPNPCGETPNRGDEPCSLGSLSLARFFDRGNRAVNWSLLEECIWNATMFMDEILDRNVWPHPDIAKAALLTRKLGLGVMGWADLLGMMHIHYDTQEALDLASKVASFIEEVSHGASEHLVKIKGPYLGYDPVRTNAPMRRNETNTSIAPTGSIAVIGGVYSGIEPFWELDALRETACGMLLQDGVQDWVREQFDGFVPKVAREISPEWHVRMQAAWQEHVDLGVSKTVNLPKSATVQDVSDTYKLMYDMGCKGGTIFRNGCRKEQVLHEKPSGKTSANGFAVGNGHTKDDAAKTVAANIESATLGQADGTIHAGTGGLPGPGEPWPMFELNGYGKDLDLSEAQLATLRREIECYQNGLQRLVVTQGTQVKPGRRRLPKRRKAGPIQKFNVSGTEFYLHQGLYDEGTLGEIFVSGNFGTTVAGLLNAFCITFSIALQSGASLAELVKAHKNTHFEPRGMTDCREVPTCTSIPDLLVRWLAREYLGEKVAGEILKDESGSGMFCPECSTEAVYRSGCLSCPKAECGWSRCG